MHATLADAYAGERFVEVASLAESAAIKTLDPEGLNGTNRMKLFVFGHDEQMRGSSRCWTISARARRGAAVQNLNIALGLEEGAGLV